ncbi:solute carrier family 13 member 4-like [Haemaphysalis longicornis]
MIISPHNTDPRLIVGVDAAAPEIEENEDNKDQPKAPCILRHRNTAKMFLLEAHRLQKIKKALLINVANGSAVGCMANILGSISGIYLRDYFHGAYGYDAVTALSWTLVGLPVAGVSLFLSGFITYFLFLRPYDIREDTETLKIINGIISKKRKFLGGLTWKEALLGASMIVIFIMCIAIKFITVLLGLGEHISIWYRHESLNVFLVLLLVSLLPNASNSEPLFDWRHVPERISWRTVLTIGGGFALTGVIEGILTKVHPLYYALAVAMASCTPAVLPTAAPSIAIVTSAMDVDIGDTLYPGLAVKLATILLVLASVNIGGEALFSWNELPAWVQQAHRDRRSKGSACTALANHTSLPDIFSISSAYSVY